MQPQKISCANCGTELLPDGRFCRRCGQPSNTRSSVTEVTTRKLETAGQPFSNVGDAATAQPAGLEQQPGPTRQVASAETQSLAPAGSTLKRWLPGLVLLFIAIFLPVIYVLREWRQTTVIPPATAPTASGPAGVPQPPEPPAPPPPDTRTTKTTIDQSLIYPGSRTTMVVSKAGEGDMIQLNTDDSLDKVADWYTEKFKPTRIFRQPQSVVLRTEKTAIVITPNGDGNGTNIMLRQGAN